MLRNLLRSLLVPVLSVFSFAALAHDVWINRGAYRNPAGEWCCGAEDCGVVSPGAVKAGVGGYSLRGPVTYGEAVTGNAADGPTHTENVNEAIPYSQSLPSPTAPIGAASGRTARRAASSRRRREAEGSIKRLDRCRRA
jgi:hypothetical protein